MKKIIILALAVLLTAMLAVPALAAPQESDLVLLEREKGIVIWVSWDTAQPEVVFIAPDGTQYDPMTETEGCTTVVGSNDLYYTIEKAAAGQWRLQLDKGSNKEVTVSVHDYQVGLVVDSFAITGIEDGKAYTSFHVSGADRQYYQYRISAIVDYSGEEKELASGGAYVNRDVSQSVSLKKLATYSDYRLRLYVWYENNGTDVFDFMISEPFAYTNTENDAKATDFTVTVQPQESLLYVAWPNADRSVDSVLVAVFEDDAAEPVSYDFYDTDDYKSVQLAYTPGVGEVAVEVSYSVNGVQTAPLRKTAKLAQMPVSIPEGQIFGSVTLPMAYTGLRQQPVTVTVNGKATTLNLDGDGTVSITLVDGWNDLQICYTDGVGITWQIARQIFVDRIPPVLNLNQSYDGMVVKGSSITVSGTVSNFESLTVNGEAVSVNADGSFSREVKLSAGENIITVVAADALGNESLYTGCVTSGEITVTEAAGIPGEEKADPPGSLIDRILAPGSYWVLLGVSLVGLLVIGYALIFWRREDKK